MTGVWIRKCDSFEQEAEADREFWARLSPDERVAVVEDLRLEWAEQQGEDEPGLRRAVRVLAAPWR